MHLGDHNTPTRYFSGSDLSLQALHSLVRKDASNIQASSVPQPQDAVFLFSAASVLPVMFPIQRFFACTTPGA
jgi:hypothetical protein